MIIKNYNQFIHPTKINEGLIANALSSIFSIFKDIGKDFKNMFKEDDPNSIKQILLTNLNKAIEKEKATITNLKDDEIGDLMVNLAKGLTNMANSINSSIDNAIGKDKDSGAKEVAKAILLGNKEANWAGIIGLIDPTKSISKIKTNYKYSKAAYDKAMSDAANKTNGGDVLKAKKTAATNFLNEFENDIKNQLDKDFSEEELTKVYNDALKNKPSDIDLNLKQGDEVIYLLKGKSKNDYDDNKKPEEQKNVVGIKKIDSLDGDHYVFKTVDGKTFTKEKSEIIKKTSTTPQENLGTNATKAKEVLGTLKNDEVKMGQIANFAEFLQKNTDTTKIDAVNKIINNT